VRQGKIPQLWACQGIDPKHIFTGRGIPTESIRTDSGAFPEDERPAG
jgi:hypothetical protein